jgi:SAM-dependent methyltransferase
MIVQNRATLGSVEELASLQFRQFINLSNSFGRLLNLRELDNWSKIWEYPWIWTHLLGDQCWIGKRLLDIGTELSPVPWILSALGAQVTLVENDPQWIPRWERARELLKTSVHWEIVAHEELPFADESFECVTSFSVIEHQNQKEKAINEIVRVLTPGGTLGLSFDICEPDLGMTFPEWNGSALTIKEFEDLIWFHQAFHNHERPDWNYGDMKPFREWHLGSAIHHNYVVGAAVLRKDGIETRESAVSAAK